LKQVVRNIDIDDEPNLSWIRRDYGTFVGQEAA